MGRPRVERRTIVCLQCGKDYTCTPQQQVQKFCNKDCYNLYRTGKPCKKKKKEKPSVFKPEPSPFSKPISHIPLTGRFPYFL